MKEGSKGPWPVKTKKEEKGVSVLGSDEGSGGSGKGGVPAIWAVAMWFRQPQYPTYCGPSLKTTCTLVKLGVNIILSKTSVTTRSRSLGNPTVLCCPRSKPMRLRPSCYWRTTLEYRTLESTPLPEKRAGREKTSLLRVVGRF